MKEIIKKYLLIFLGSVALTLGMIGIVLPILPTTPFLLLASFCYLRSSKQLYQWLINHKLLGPVIKNYMVHKAVTKRAKTCALIFLWISLIVSSVLIFNIYLSLLLASIGIGVSIHLLSLKTLNKNNV